MKKVLICGASGMVGGLILEQCLASNEITQVTSLVRRKSTTSHPKLEEVVVSDFTDYTTHQALFQEIDLAFFCIGVYTGQVSKEALREITVDFAIAFGASIKDQSPKARLCFLSGAGADRTENSRTAFAKFKGMAENGLAALGLQFHSFRPAYIYPVTPRKEPNFIYRATRFCYPLIKLMGSNASIPSTDLAQAMFKVGLSGAKTEVLENREILDYV